MRTVDPFEWAERGHKPFGRAKPLRKTVNPGSIEGRLRHSFKDAMREYLETSTLKGLKYASHVETIRPLRHVYIYLMIALLVWGLCVLCYFIYDYQGLPPLRINLAQIPPDNSVPFPAVAICSNSIVSKEEMNKYSLYLYDEETKRNRFNTTYTLPMIKKNLEKFAALVTLRKSDMELLNFMRFLEIIVPNFNITDLMYSLSPKCSSMLTVCRWRGRAFPCEKLFATRLTPLGFCCVFNGRYTPEDINNPPKILNLLGKNYGLTVAVFQNIDDFAVVRRPATYELAILLFDGSDFPLLEGGAVRAYSVSTNASIFFQLMAQPQYVTDAVKSIRDEKRKCHLMEPTGPRTARSSYAWCLAECRRKSIIAICDCQPFWYPNPTKEDICTPEHLYCLNKHREKFNYYYPGEVADGSLDEEEQDSLDCRYSNCRPDCARIMHTAKVFQPNYYYPEKFFKNTVSSKISLVNQSFLRFYYNSVTHNIHKVDLNSMWYEVVAAISCQSLFLVGASLVSVAELAFHLTFRWGHHFVRRTREERTRRNKQL